MSENTYTCLTKKFPRLALVEIFAFDPRHVIWIEFDQPLRRLKAPPAIECVFQSFADELERSDAIRIRGLSIAYTDADSDHFPADHRFPLFISYTGQGPSVPQLHELAHRISNRLRSCSESTVFQSLECAIVGFEEAASEVLAITELNILVRRGVVPA